MDLTGLFLRVTAARPHVLLVTVPGGAAVRLAAERLLRARDWPQASTPANADLLLVAGPALPQLRTALERLWRDVPAPRARVYARTPDEVEAALDSGRALLGSPAVQRESAAPPGEAGGRLGGEHGAQERHESDDQAPGHDGDGAGEGEAGRAGDAHGGPYGEHAPHDAGQDTEAEHDDGRQAPDDQAPEGQVTDGQDADSHGDHGDHGGGQTDMPGGLPMAEQGADRDGLTLDRLHLPLGPFLADWPAGLTVRLVVQGDVVQRVDVDEPARPSDDAAAEAFWVQPWLRAASGEPVPVGEAVRRRAAAHLDSLGRLLAVAGWPAEAVRARRLRDDLLSGAPRAAVAPRLGRLTRRVGRSRTLAWLTRGIGVVTAHEAREFGVRGPAARAGGDVTSRYRQWLADIRDDLPRLEDPAPLDVTVEDSPRGPWSAEDPPSAALIALLPPLLEGAELAAARLVVASLDPDPEELVSRSVGEVTRG
ncbi:hypothetical protein [Streptomyces sp. SMS_SU21]|uniref:hypothetical protein n=1 Tax=Streptomyces sp. SMS_SU21 TaxID=2069440 RepID=UPI000C8806AD|nr:hypothetical protein [Streptomyces sp. SMS_SU21]MCA2201982.1 hypothetical protein [Streptomyces sp. SMS_SU21]